MISEAAAAMASIRCYQPSHLCSAFSRQQAGRRSMTLIQSSSPATSLLDVVAAERVATGNQLIAT